MKDFKRQAGKKSLGKYDKHLVIATMTRVITGFKPSGIKGPLLPFCTHQPFEDSSFIRTSSAITFEKKDYEGKGRDWRFRKELTGHFEEYHV